MQLKALLFDVDGTLAETEMQGHRVAFNRAFTDAGVDWHWTEEVYRDLLKVTGGKERMLHWWQQIDPEAAAHADSKAAIAAMHQNKTQHYADLVRDGEVTLREGAGALLAEALASDYQVGIATTTTLGNVEALITANLGQDALGSFAFIGAGDVVAHKKPAADIYHWVLDKLALPAQACVAFEDSYPGVCSATSAEIPTVLIRCEDFPIDSQLSLPTVLEDRPDYLHTCQHSGSKQIEPLDLQRVQTLHSRYSQL